MKTSCHLSQTVTQRVKGPPSLLDLFTIVLKEPTKQPDPKLLITVTNPFSIHPLRSHTPINTLNEDFSVEN